MGKTSQFNLPFHWFSETLYLIMRERQQWDKAKQGRTYMVTNGPGLSLWLWASLMHRLSTEARQPRVGLMPCSVHMARWPSVMTLQLCENGPEWWRHQSGISSGLHELQWRPFSSSQNCLRKIRGVGRGEEEGAGNEEEKNNCIRVGFHCGWCHPYICLLPLRSSHIALSYTS